MKQDGFTKSALTIHISVTVHLVWQSLALQRALVLPLFGRVLVYCYDYVEYVLLQDGPLIQSRCVGARRVEADATQY